MAASRAVRTTDSLAGSSRFMPRLFQYVRSSRNSASSTGTAAGPPARASGLWHGGMGTPACPGCRERDARIAALEQQVAELQATVRELLARLGNNAANSGIPPSANPPGAPKPVVKPPSPRRRGGQPG